MNYSKPLSSSYGSRLRAMLPLIPFYVRLLLVASLSMFCRTVRVFIGSARTQRLEQMCLAACNVLYRSPFDPATFLDIEAFVESQDTSDFFTLCRRVGVENDWFRDRRILDIGCGPGTFTLAVAELAPLEIEGIDIAANRIAFASERARRRGLLNTHFHHASVYDLPFPENHFDRIISHTVFEHLPDVVGALTAMYRVLKPGGEAVITHDSFRSRYGAHVAHFVRIPWPCGFFSEQAVTDFWKDQCASFLEERGIADLPELLDLSDGILSLNRLTMSALEDAMARSDFEVLMMVPYGQEKALLDLLPCLARSRWAEYLIGSRVIRLRKPGP
jgi:SAM-dependent methyltransferase